MKQIRNKVSSLGLTWEAREQARRVLASNWSQLLLGRLDPVSSTPLPLLLLLLLLRLFDWCEKRRDAMRSCFFGNTPPPLRGITIFRSRLGNLSYFLFIEYTHSSSILPSLPWSVWRSPCSPDPVEDRRFDRLTDSTEIYLKLLLSTLNMFNSSNLYN